MKQAIVTGGTRGIGAGVARSLAHAGWSVVAASVSQAELDAFAPQNDKQELHKDVLAFLKAKGFIEETYV